MGNVAAGVLGMILAAAGVYLLCRHLSCAPLPAGLGAAAWAFSQPLLAPGSSPAGLSGIGSSCLIPFAVAGAFSREKRRWPFLVLALVCVLARWRAGTAAAAGTSALEAFVIAVLAAIGAQRLWDGEAGFAFGLGAAGVLALAVLGASNPGPAVLVEALPAAAALVVCAALPREVRARAGLALLMAIFGAQRLGELTFDAPPRSSVIPAEARR